MKEAFVNAMVTAIEGGSNYWCDEIGFYDKDRNHMSMEDWFKNGDSIKVVIHEGDDVPSVVFTEHAKFFRNVEKFFPDWVETFSDDANYDAVDADNLLQFGVFEELVYG